LKELVVPAATIVVNGISGSKDYISLFNNRSCWDSAEPGRYFADK